MLENIKILQKIMIIRIHCHLIFDTSMQNIFFLVNSNIFLQCSNMKFWHSSFKAGNSFYILKNCKFDKKCFRVSYVIVSKSELHVYLASSFVISSIYANFFCQNLIMERTFLFPCQMLNIIHHYIHHHIIISRYSEYVSLVLKSLLYTFWYLSTKYLLLFNVSQYCKIFFLIYWALEKSTPPHK